MLHLLLPIAGIVICIALLVIAICKGSARADRRLRELREQKEAIAKLDELNKRAADEALHVRPFRRMNP